MKETLKLIETLRQEAYDLLRRNEELIEIAIEANTRVDSLYSRLGEYEEIDFEKEYNLKGEKE